MYGTCLGMIVYMALTLTIFITLFNSLRDMSSYKIYTEYMNLKETYVTTVVENEGSLTEEQIFAENATISDETINKANASVIEKYGEIKTGFIWIKNIWRPDSTAKVTLSYDDFISNTKADKAEITEIEYNKVMKPVANSEEFSGSNGLFLLAVITGLTSFGSLALTNLIRKLRAKKKGLLYTKGAENNIVMMIIMPIIMALFTLFYNSAFGLYIVSGNLFSLVTSPLISLLVDVIDEKQALKEENKHKASYSR